MRAVGLVLGWLVVAWLLAVTGSAIVVILYVFLRDVCRAGWL